jgi:uncharacterized protein (DUF427 family)
MSDQAQRQTPRDNQESVWDYPRPPRVEPTGKLIRVVFNDQTVAETRRALRVLETRHPPVYYLPPEDVRTEWLTGQSIRTICEFKGAAAYWTLKVGGRVSENAAWSYPDPTPAFRALQGYIAFYASRVDACFVDGEQVKPQPGDFYGGWITSDIIGPFKGGPGTTGW